MADYFLVHEGHFFAEQFRPALAAAWQARNFEPARALCQRLVPAARDYLHRYHAGPEEPVLCQVAQGLDFDRNFWRTLVGEILLFAAIEMPELPTNLDSLVALVASKRSDGQGGANSLDLPERERLAPIQQALQGSRHLSFGSAIYRPLQAGLNHAADVARLADYLAGVRPEEWKPMDLPGIDPEDAEDELAFAREWFPVLVDLYHRSRSQGRVIVLEQIY